MNDDARGSIGPLVADLISYADGVGIPDLETTLRKAATVLSQLDSELAGTRSENADLRAALEEGQIVWTEAQENLTTVKSSVNDLPPDEGGGYR